tara:strand:+ start:39748 stop:40698 length:951 start_codon:yes stop_codon:yes gene_type:complete
MEFKDYYDILGVNPQADKKVIKTAYRRLARKYHPDVSKETDAENKFKEVAEAYEVLGSDEKRAEYDELRKYGRKGQPFEPPPGWEPSAGGHEFNDADLSEFFSSIFGDRYQQSAPGQGNNRNEYMRSQRGQDVEIEMPLSLEETLKKEPKTIEYMLPQFGESGRLADIKKTLKVKIPKGAIDGERIRLKGQGGPGIGKAPPGDLYLKIKLVPHSLFDVSGYDLTLTVPIAPWEAALGTNVNVPTLSGRINLTIAPESQTGQRLRLKGKGLPGKSKQGDLYVVLKVVMPKQFDSDSIKLWQELASKANYNPRSDLEN